MMLRELFSLLSLLSWRGGVFVNVFPTAAARSDWLLLMLRSISSEDEGGRVLSCVKSIIVAVAVGCTDGDMRPSRVGERERME